MQRGLPPHHLEAMKGSALALSAVVGASLISPAAPARAGVLSNLLGTAAEAVQPGTGGVVRSGWGLLRGVGRAVIPRRRQSRSAGSAPASAQAGPPKTPPTSGTRELTVEDLLLNPPPPPAMAISRPAIERP
jgi:hypothetical protein